MTKKMGFTIVVLIALLALVGCGRTPTPVAEVKPRPATPTVEEAAVPPAATVGEVTATETASLEEATTPAKAPVEEATATTVVKEVPTATAVTVATPMAVETPAPEITAAARVNGQAIPLAEYQKQVAQARVYFIGEGLDPSSAEGKETLAQVGRQVLDQLIDQVLIEQAAAREGITVSDEEVEASIQKIREEMGEERFNESLATANLTYEDFVRTQRSMLIGNAVIAQVIASLPPEAEQVHARHILVETRAEAEQALARLRGGEDFAALAKELSLDETSRDQGGDLDWFPRQSMAAALEEVAFALAPGETSEVVQTDYGFHILQVIEKDPAREIPPQMWESLRQQAFMSWLEEQRAQATIERFVAQ